VENAASAARGAPQAARIGSLVAETIVLVNPARNYAQFLLRALLPMVLHVIIALAAGYAVGSEFRRRSMRAWLACAGGNPIIALAGKLAPLFAIFVVIMLTLPLILEGLLGISFRGHAPMVVIAAMLLIVGYLALGALMQLLVRDLATGLGLTGLIVSPAFGYAGVGFPVLGMNAFAFAWGAILPLRWYMAVLLGQAARGLPLSDSARPFAALAALAVVYALLAFLRLRAIAASTSHAAPEAEPIAASVPSLGLGGAFAAEWRRVLAMRGAFMLPVLGPLVYGIYYPQPYLNQIVRKIPIAVVDNDLTELSRGIVQTLDASGAVSVVVQAETLAEARKALDRGEAFAVVGIPPDTERDVLKGNTSHIPIYADATYLFIFRSMASGIAVVIALPQTAGGAFATVLGRGIAHLTIFLPSLALYFIVLPRVYGFSTLGDPLQLFALASLFTLATSFMGQAAGAWFKHPETPTLIFLGTSLPQLFLTGFSWPREAIPAPVLKAGYIFPSDFAIDGMVRIDQLGATLWEVVRDWRGLWALAIIYFALAVMSAALVKRRRAHA
jgi:hypothetical protein